MANPLSQGDGIYVTLMPDSDWHKRQCGECGYFGEHIEFKHEIPEECYGCGRIAVCRRARVRVAEDEPACPSFIQRPAPEENKEDDNETV